MYQTLYRKYRPNNFDEVVGQDVIIKTLKNAILKNKLSHAYLFTGPRGTGKTSVAKILAKTINCENLKEYIPCNKCVSCTQINNKQTIDIIEIDAASNNGVDEIRELRNKVNLVPSVGKYKVYIIDEVHMLTTGAFNALLKTLEEPPNHAVFILATTEPHKIPITILSRCQRFDFKKIGLNNMIDRLKYIIKQENIDAEDNVLKEISRLSDGCMRDALSILDQVVAYADDKITIDDVHEINGTIAQAKLKEFITAIVDNDYEYTFKLIEQYDNDGKNFIKLTEEIILFLKNVLLNINVENFFVEDSEEKSIYDELSKKFDNEKIIRYIKIFNEAIYNMKKASNVKIIFEMTLIEIINYKQPKQENIQNIQVIKQEQINNKPQQEENKKVEKQNKKIEPKTEKIKDKNLEKLVNIRINNCLCKFDKKQLLSLKSKIEEIRLLIINPDYSELAAMIIDGELKAASDEYIIFVFGNSRDSDNFNEKMYEIDKMLSEQFDKQYKTVAVDQENWNNIKQEFNNKLKKYEYIEEPTLDMKKNTEIEELFDEIIEYS